MRSGVRIAALLVALMVAGAGAARGQAPESPTSGRLEARYQIAVMEAALEQAVHLGASQLNLRIQSVAPDMVFLAGAPRARGFRLDDYGVFFHVDVPVMRPSLAWALRALRQNDPGVGIAALEALRRRVEAISDQGLREALQRDVRQVERALPTLRTTSTATAPERGARAAQAASPSENEGEGREAATAIADDPNEAYTNAVKDALITAMLDYSPRLPLAAHEWLTVAARDQEGSRLQAGDPYGASTIVLRIRGEDLEAYHAERIDAAEARRRVRASEH